MGRREARDAGFGQSAQDEENDLRIWKLDVRLRRNVERTLEARAVARALIDPLDPDDAVHDRAQQQRQDHYRRGQRDDP